MSIEHISCPHCNSPLANNGRLAGQVVSCPTCRGQFQMPPVAPPITRPQPVVVEGTMPVIHVFQTSRRGVVRRPPGMWDVSLSRVVGALFTILVSCGLGVLLVVFVAVNQATFQDAQSAKETNSPSVVVSESHVDSNWQTRGYQEGYASGLKMRNHNLQPEASFAMYFQIGKDRNEGRDRSHISYEIDPDYPQRGTNEYGDYKAGFERGYYAGLYGSSR